MIALPRELLSLMEKNLHFECNASGTCLVEYPHTTGWRMLPILVVTQADYVSSVELKDGKTVRVEPGQTVSLVPGLAHNLTKLTRRAEYSRWSHVKCEVFPGISLFNLIEPPLIIKGSQSRKIGRINHQLGRVSGGERSLPSLLKRQALGWELILTLLQSVSVNEDRLDLIRHASRLMPVLSYIEENLAKPITHGLMAQIAGLSPSRFHFLFRSALGSPPYEYVQKVRLKKAQNLLIRTDRSIAEIGREVGHPDPYHFSRTFCRNFGVSPVKYRQQVTSRSF
jgi:AraC-like DNA-binding protein